MTAILLHSFNEDFSKLVDRQPDKVALLDAQGRKLTYHQLAHQVQSAQAWLTDIGIGPGNVVIAILPNSIETIILFLASLRGGFTYAPLPCTATLPEIQRWKTITKAHFCLFANSISNAMQKTILQMDWQATLVNIAGEKNWQQQSQTLPVEGGKLVMASSGSTGEPKAMLLDINRLWSAGYAFLHYHNIENADVRFWNYLPMSYLGGLFNLTLIPLAAGGSIFVDDAFNGKTFLVFWSTIARFNINSLWLVPTILRGLLALSERSGQASKHYAIQHCFLGTAPISLEEKRRFALTFGVQPLENYGLSETTFISSEHIKNIDLHNQSSVGAVMPNVDIKFVPALGEETLATEIFVRTPYCMLGYLNEQGQIETNVDQEGFLPTGDFGQLIQGQLQLLGRRRDIIKKGGLLVVLRELEWVAESFPGIIEVAAVKVDHPFYGESCVLYIRGAESITNQDLFVAQFTSWLHEQLARHKWPEEIIYCSEFPKTASGKIQKHLLSTRKVTHA